MDNDELGMDEFEQLSDEERMALLMGGESPEPVPAEPVEVQGDNADPAQTLAPEATAAQPTNEEAPNDVVENYKGMAHAERQQRQQLQALLQDPNALAQYVQQMGYQLTPAQQAAMQQQAPGLEFEDPAAIQAIVQQAVQPFQEQLQQATSYIQRLEQQQQQMEAERQLTEKYGTDAVPTVKAFDQQYPHLAGMPADVKYMTAIGLKFSDPQQVQALVQTQAEKLAASQVEQALKGGKPNTSVTISGISPAQQNDTAIDASGLDQHDWDKMPESKRMAILMGKRVSN